MATLQQIRELTVKGQSQGLDTVKRDLEGVAAAQQKVAATSDTMAAATDRASGSTLSTTKQFEALARAIDPVAKAQEQLDRAQRIVNASRAQGTVSADAAARVMQLHQQRLEAATRASQLHSASTGASRYQLQQLSFQLTDAATMLASGASPFQVLATQGGQVVQALQMGQGGVGGSLKAIGTRLAGLVGPATIVFTAIAAGAAAAAIAWHKVDEAIRGVERSMNGIGRNSGMTAGQLTGIANRAQSYGLSMGASYGAVSGFTGAGINGGVTEQLMGMIRPYSRAFGMDVEAAMQSLTKAVSNPVHGLDELAKRFGPLNVAFIDQVRMLDSSGRASAAQAAIAAKFAEELAKTKDTTSAFQKALDAAAARASTWFWRFGQSVAGPTRDERIDELNKLIEARGGNPNNRIVQRQMQERDKLIAERDREAAEGARKAKEAEQELQRNRMSAIQKAQQMIVADGQVTAQAITAQTASQRLAAEIERKRLDAVKDTTKAVTLAAEIERARTVAIAEATRALQEQIRSIRQELFVGGASNEAERIRRQTQVERENLNRQLDVLQQQKAAAPLAPGVANSNLPVLTGKGAGGLDASFQERLRAFFDALGGSSQIWINSGFRSGAQQAALYAQAGGVGVAPQGRSFHERGLAADLGFASPAVQAMAHEMAAQFGLAFPLKNWSVRKEPWHVEPAETRGGAFAGTGPRPLTITRGAAANDNGLMSADALANARIQQQLVNPLFRQWDDNLMAQERALKASADTFGQSTAAVAAQAAAVRAETELRQKGVTVTAAMAQQIAVLAEREGQLAAAREREAERQQRVIGQMDAFRDGLSDMIASPLKAMAHGQSASKAFQQAGARMFDRLIDTQVKRIGELLLGKNGKPGGGLFGDLLGGLVGKSNTGMMDVQAGIVNISGMGGLGGGAGGFGGIFASLFGGGGANPITGGLWANGGAFSGGNVIPFATGDVFSKPVGFPMAGGRMGVMGEAGPEAIMPLKRGRDGRLGVAASGGHSTSAAPVTVNVHNAPGHTASVQESQGPNGERELTIMIEAVTARSIARNGAVGKSIQGMYGARRMTGRA